MEELRKKQGFICDMDGVIYHGNKLLPGVKEFVDWLYAEKKNFLFLTNSSERSPKELQQKLRRMGLEVDESHFYTSALATARFISSQAPVSYTHLVPHGTDARDDVDVRVGRLSRAAPARRGRPGHARLGHRGRRAAGDEQGCHHEHPRLEDAADPRRLAGRFSHRGGEMCIRDRAWAFTLRSWSPTISPSSRRWRMISVPTVSFSQGSTV